MRRNLFVDGLQQDLQLVVAGALAESSSRGHAFDSSILDRKPEHLGETRLTRAKEPGDPNRYTFVRLVWGLGVSIEDVRIVTPNRWGNDILIDLIAQDCLGRLIDLDHLLDLLDSSADEPAT